MNTRGCLVLRKGMLDLIEEEGRGFLERLDDFDV
jgi:hypothetical protein